MHRSVMSGSLRHHPESLTTYEKFSTSCESSALHMKTAGSSLNATLSVQSGKASRLTHLQLHCAYVPVKCVGPFVHDDGRNYAGSSSTILGAVAIGYVPVDSRVNACACDHRKRHLFAHCCCAAAIHGPENRFARLSCGLLYCCHDIFLVIGNLFPAEMVSL